MLYYHYMTVEELEQIRKIVSEEVRGAIKEEVPPVVQEEVKMQVNIALKPVKKSLTKIDHTIELVLKYHDEMYLRQRKRIEHLEEITGISSN